MTTVHAVDIIRVLPEAVLTGFAILVMILDPFIPANHKTLLAWLSLAREVGALYRPDLSLVWLGGGLEPYHDVAFDHGADRRLAAGATRVYRPNRQDVGGATRGQPPRSSARRSSPAPAARSSVRARKRASPSKPTWPRERLMLSM